MKKPVISIKEIDMKIIAIRFTGSYREFRKQSGHMVKNLFSFAESHDLIEEGVTKVMTIYHDNPYITPSDKMRTSVAMSVPDACTIIESGRVIESRIQGKFGVGSFEISQTEYGEAWNYMYHEWLFKETVVGRDAVPFELYVDEPPRNKKSTSHTDIYIPIE